MMVHKGVLGTFLCEMVTQGRSICGTCAVGLVGGSLGQSYLSYWTAWTHRMYVHAWMGFLGRIEDIDGKLGHVCHYVD